MKSMQILTVTAGLLVGAAQTAYAYDWIDAEHEMRQDQNIKKNKKDIAKNAEDIAENSQNIADNRNNIADNRNNIADNRNNIAQNRAGLIDLNNKIDSQYRHLDGKVKKVRARADAGIAGATAIGSLAFDTLKANSIAGGLGIAKNKVAGAIGYQRNFSANWRARGTVSVSDNYVQGGASIGYSW